MGHIVHIGKRIGVDYSRTYSCYRGGEKHCGVYGTCNERKEAMRDAGSTTQRNIYNNTITTNALQTGLHGFYQGAWS